LEAAARAAEIANAATSAKDAAADEQGGDDTALGKIYRFSTDQIRIFREYLAEQMDTLPPHTKLPTKEQREAAAVDRAVAAAAADAEQAEVDAKAAAAAAAAATEEAEAALRAKREAKVERLEAAAVISESPVRAVAKFDATDDVELSFEDGEELHVLDIAAPDGWSMARNASSVQGLVPVAYLKEKEIVSVEAPAAAQVATTPASLDAAKVPPAPSTPAHGADATPAPAPSITTRTPNVCRSVSFEGGV
jgi:hypothetical protein